MGSLQRHKSFWKDACERNEAAVNVTKTWIRHAWEKTSNRSLREERNTEKCKRQRKDGLIYRAWWSLSVAGKQWGDIKLTKSSSNWEPFGGGLTLNSLKSFFGVLKVWDGAWNLNVSLNIILALFVFRFQQLWIQSSSSTYCACWCDVFWCSRRTVSRGQRWNSHDTRYGEACLEHRIKNRGRLMTEDNQSRDARLCHSFKNIIIIKDNCVFTHSTVMWQHLRSYLCPPEELKCIFALISSSDLVSTNSWEPLMTSCVVTFGDGLVFGAGTLPQGHHFH